MIIIPCVGRGKDAQDAQAGIRGEIAVHHVRKDEGRLVLPDSLCPVLDGDLQRALQEIDQLYGAVEMGRKGDVPGEGAAEFVLFVFIKRLHEKLLSGNGFRFLHLKAGRPGQVPRSYPRCRRVLPEKQQDSNL